MRYGSKRLGWIFALVVLVPGILLSVIAVRSIDREEAYIEKQLEGTLLAEVVYLASLVETELGRIESELTDSAPVDPLADPGSVLVGWRDASALVTSPFLLSAQFEILWPRGNGDLDEGELSFLRWNSDFLSNRLEVPVFENIALAYKDEIVPPTETEKRSVGILQQQAKSQFEMNEEVQQKLYEQAFEEGRAAQSRLLLPSAPAAGQQEEPPPSIFISRDLRLDEITKDRDQGLIPRFVEERLSLLFWKRLSDGLIVGCVIADAELRDRLISLIPDVYTAVRIITLVDEQGRPLAAPEEIEARDYRRPFVARECSALLPLWEAAAYLTDPGAVSSQAGRVAGVLWALISILFVSILVGGILVLRAVRAEVLLARQKTGFVANVSHELKTPLTSIRMFAEMLETGRQTSEGKRQEYLSLMVSESERLTRLINNVLDFSRMEQGRKHYAMEVLDPVALCRELVDNQRPRYEQNGFHLELRVRTGEEGGRGAAAAETVWIQGDPESLKQSLLNLLSNAEKYSGEQKSIEVEIRREGRWVYMDVMDRGRGVPAAQTKRIFEEFYRGDDSLTAKVRGSGLGLAITRRILRDHGGDVLYIPREGGGSIFRIQLPVVDNQ
ncbi:MAG: HAMP domain-containing histidine kinase [Spirochaetaceae bacterium]|nr:MAG: HAMP domain-containing histidine kinase [Spirochaetaceae bacterium]